MNWTAIKIRVLKRLLSVGFSLFNVKSIVFASVSAIVEKDGEVLLVRLSYENGYALPGGMLQAGENFAEGIHREILEETGLTVQIDDLVGIFPSVTRYPKINVCYRVSVTGGRLRSSAEGVPEWVKLEEVLSKLVYMDNRKALEAYLESAEI